MAHDAVKFLSGFNAYVCIGDSIECEHGPFTITATIEHDSDTGAPWLEHDGHGPVSDWTTRAKRPGELLLHSDGPHKRYYDFAQACRIARRDGWGISDAALQELRGPTRRVVASEYHVENGIRQDKLTWEDCAPRKVTKRMIASASAMSDYESLKAWCNDEWYWGRIVVTVTHTESEIELASDSLWGIDANYPGSDNSYLTDCAMELAESALSEARNRAKELATALQGVE